MEYKADDLYALEKEPILKVLKMIEGQPIHYERWSPKGVRNYTLSTKILEPDAKAPKVLIQMISPAGASCIEQPKNVKALLNYFFNITFGTD